MLQNDKTINDIKEDVENNTKDIKELKDETMNCFIIHIISRNFFHCLDKYKIFIIPQKLSSNIHYMLIERASTI